MRKLIKHILKEEVTKKYSKPTSKVEQLVYRWLNNYFDGAKMYYDKSWETRHDFEWCNHGKEIMKFILFFEENIDVYDDRRITEERDCKSVAALPATNPPKSKTIPPTTDRVNPAKIENVERVFDILNKNGLNLNKANVQEKLKKIIIVSFLELTNT